MTAPSKRASSKRRGSRRALYLDSRRWPERPRRLRRGHTIHRDGLATGDVFVPHDEYRTSTGIRVTHAQHYYRGLRVFRSSRVFKDDRGKRRSTPPLYRLPKRLVLVRDVTPSDALKRALAFLQKRGVVSPGLKLSVLRETRMAHLTDVPSIVEVRRGLLGPARMHLEIFPRTRDQFELAWVVDLALTDRRAFQLVVSARGKKAGVRFLALTSMCAFGASWTPSPLSIVREQFPIPPIATPDGVPGTASNWLTSASVAKGPNVWCLSADRTRFERLGSLQVDNVFVWCNLLHDLFAGFGFDSNHHAFDNDDPLQAIRHTVAKPNPAFFDNWVDGVKPQLNLYGSPFDGHHAGEDPSILVHEYAHGVSSRLVGGATCQYPFATPQAQGFSEGLSDYFALTVLNYVDRSRGGFGGLTLFGQAFKPAPGALRDYSNHQGTWNPQSNDPYQVGMVWCAGLLEARQRIATSTSDDAADRFVWQACIDCLKLMAPECKESLELTLKHAKETLLDAMTALENRHPQFHGAATATDAALGDRNI